MFERWQIWGTKPELESKHNVKRLQGELSEMESTKQLVEIVSKIYESKMNVLDVGCNVGHYLLGLRRKFPNLDYTGVDAYEYYINEAQKAFSSDTHANFEVKDIHKPLFTEEKFDIVYCCNVLLHLPDFRIPITNLLNSTKKCCIIRTLLSDYTTIVKAPIVDDHDELGDPNEFWYLNTWNKKYFDDFIKKLGWKTEYVQDQFNSQNVQEEFEKGKDNDSEKGTRILGDKQIVDNIIFNWVWVIITK